VAQVDFFRSDIRNAIENATVNVVGNTLYKSQCQTPAACKVFVNVGEEIREGFEVTVHSTPLSRLTLDANYSFLNRSLPTIPTAISIDGLPATIPAVYLTGTPKHKAVGTATVRLPRKMLFLATARYESGAYYQLDGSSSGFPTQAPPFGTVDLGGVAPLSSKVTLQLGVNNLFDRLYYYQEGYPQPGRNWYVRMRYRY
jgi:iron complex outermembrane receptor protein